MSGGLLRIPKEEYRSLESFIAGEKNMCSLRLLEQLMMGRMLIPDDGNELDLLARKYEASRYDATHFALTIVTSLGCNFDCPYCFEDKHPSILNKEVENAILDVLDDQLKKIRNFSVTWFGGEPLIGKKSLIDLSLAFLERCEKSGVNYYSDIITNGYLLDEETCAELRDCKVTNAQVGLDGPPEIHDRMRPLKGGQGNFWTIIKNLHHAISYLDITIRVNIDAKNFEHSERLFQILADEGFSGKLKVYAGQLVAVNDGVASPSSTYSNCCFNNKEFAYSTLKFNKLAQKYGFSQPELAKPTGAPCTAVRANELVVGSAGELYKCWDSVGNILEIIGNIKDYCNPNGRLHKWLKYNPLENDECRNCIALPVCMGGCAHHAMDTLTYENRCSTFRHIYTEEITNFIESVDKLKALDLKFSTPNFRKMETR